MTDDLPQSFPEHLQYQKAIYDKKKQRTMVMNLSLVGLKGRVKRRDEVQGEWNLWMDELVCQGPLNHKSQGQVFALSRSKAASASRKSHLSSYEKADTPNTASEYEVEVLQVRSPHQQRGHHLGSH